ncbi:MAG: hypothetical protein P8J87_16645, partial [Verrucomicrobiales bacterium]|nr:hypothetical protein [Verrucomicrobiales bacterium]
GEFLTYTLLVDDRLELFAHLGGGISKAGLMQARLLEDSLSVFPGSDIQASLPVTDRLRVLAIAMSWWTLAIEGTIAAAFLLARPAWLQRWRDWLLLSFIGTTYVFVPVLGFGYILTIMGLASCARERTRVRVAYLAVLVLLQLSQLPLDRLA